ncbi:MAG: DUF1905 domain-containing protein [Bacteroidota bacterium]
MKKFTSTIVPVFQALSYIGLIVPRETALSFIGDNARIKCSINGNKPFQGALMPMGDGDYFVIVNKKRRKEWSLELNQDIHVVLEKDNSKYGLPLPLEFEELLYQDPDGNELFHSLTPGKQRSLLYMIGKPKSEQKRLEKAVVVLNYLRKSGGKVNFADLNEAFKEANRR